MHKSQVSSNWNLQQPPYLPTSLPSASVLRAPARVILLNADLIASLLCSEIASGSPCAQDKVQLPLLSGRGST